MPIPPYQQWMSDTVLGVLRPRSSQMKAVDEAILNYERTPSPDSLYRIKNAFEDWKRWKGMNWRMSDRNATGAITRLDAELSVVADYRMHQITTFTMEELQALAYMSRERKKVIASVFTGKEVTFRNSPRAIKEAVKEAAHDVEAKCLAAKAFLEGRGKKSPLTAKDIVRQKFTEMVKAMFQVSSLESLGSLAGLVIGILEKTTVTIAPVVGQVKDGYDLFTGWAKAAASLHEQHSISDCKYVIEIGSPQAAFEGVKTCLSNQTKNEVAGASIATTSFALKTGLAFTDGGAISGPVVGAANAVASLSLQLYWLATEFKATRAVNEALADDHLDVTLFKTYPLMGCYLMTSATFSDLIPIECFGTPGWMDYVEGMKKRNFDGIYESSAGLIDNSPWEIKGLPKRPEGSAGIQFGVFRGAASGLKDLGGNVKDFFSNIRKS